jgi:alkanesulfonate monooxygenase SsuD/methylene tetrahydromethanopterin reductase-like flavin-dependent oxidoreductase (luciferase family)
VAETRAEATAAAETPARAIFEAHSREWLGPPPESLEELFTKVFYVVGTPDTVAAELDRYVRCTGVNGLNVMPHGPSMPAATVRRCMRMIAEEVVPRMSSVRHDLAA